MSRRSQWIVFAGVLLAGAAACWHQFMGGKQWIHARSLIASIESYCQRTGHLPDPSDAALMQSLGFELRAGFHPDYERKAEDQYVLTFFEGFDGPCWMYESSSGDWKKAFPPAPGR